MSKMNINDYKKRFESDYKNEDLKIAHEKVEKRRKENDSKERDRHKISFGLKDNEGW